MTETLEAPNGNALARAEQHPMQKSERWSAGVGQRGIVLSSFSDLWKMSQAIAASGLAPKNMQKVETIFVALEMGMEVGLAPMASVRSIAVINGRPAIYGDAALALVRASGLLESFEERIEGQGDARRAICISKRKGMPSPRTTTFSIADAKNAFLLGKDGPWKQYSDRMLQFRARGFNLRDEFGDVLNGMVTVEEAQDIPPENGGVQVQQQVPQRGVAGLVQRLSSDRPVSSGQQLVNDETGEVIETPQEQAASDLQSHDFARPEPEAHAEAQEPDVAGAEAEPPGDAMPQAAQSPVKAPDAKEKFWIDVQEACESAGLTDPKDWKNRVKKWALKVGKVGKEHTAAPKETRALFDAIRKREQWFA